MKINNNERTEAGILPQSVCFSFTPSEIAQKLYYYPTWCGHYYCNSNYYIDRPTFPSILVAFICQRTFEVKYRRQHFEAQRGDVVILDCTEPHYYHAKGECEFFYINFTGCNSHQMSQYIIAQKGALIRQQSNILISKELHSIVDFNINDGIENMFNSSMRIYRIFEALFSDDDTIAKKDNPINDTIHYIRKNIASNLSLDVLSGIANMSPYYFAHSFKKQTGFSPIEFVINTRIDHAKSLLVSTAQTVEEIAYQSGYNSSSSFITAFIKRMDISPKQYRKYYQTGCGASNKKGSC